MRTLEELLEILNLIKLGVITDINRNDIIREIEDYL